MIDFKSAYKCFSKPPNTENTYLPHPYYGSSECIELGVFNEHRFAFYFWAKWAKEKKENITPDLVTFDWHQDLAYPSDIEKRWLASLDISDMFEISFYSWAKLNPLNDNHIVSAAYLDLIGDVYVVCKDFRFGKRDDVEKVVDMNGKTHFIRKFDSYEKLLESVSIQDVKSLYLDVDLDYFTIDNISTNDKQRFTYMSNKEIQKIFKLEDSLMQWVIKRLEGITIALEPEHVGNIVKSMKYFCLLERILFEGSVFDRKAKWNFFSK